MLMRMKCSKWSQTGPLKICVEFFLLFFFLSFSQKKTFLQTTNAKLCPMASAVIRGKRISSEREKNRHFSLEQHLWTVSSVASLHRTRSFLIEHILSSVHSQKGILRRRQVKTREAARKKKRDEFVFFFSRGREQWDFFRSIGRPKAPIGDMAELSNKNGKRKKKIYEWP